MFTNTHSLLKRFAELGETLAKPEWIEGLVKAYHEWADKAPIPVLKIDTTHQVPDETIKEVCEFLERYGESNGRSS